MSNEGRRDLTDTKRTLTSAATWGNQKCGENNAKTRISGKKAEYRRKSRFLLHATQIPLYNSIGKLNKTIHKNKMMQSPSNQVTEDKYFYRSKSDFRTMIVCHVN